MAVRRQDFAFPFRIDAVSGQAREADYEAHVMQLVEQVLLTAPAERADRPEFGCGLRALVFAGNSVALAATAEMLVRRSLARWLSTHVIVRNVEVLPHAEGSAEEDQIHVRVEYELVSTGDSNAFVVRIGP